MIFYRTVPVGYPFLWESPNQPAGRWHGQGDGPVHYFADTPDGAWAEFLRHAEIEADELSSIQRAFWVIECDVEPEPVVNLPHYTLTGGAATYSTCQQAARRMRSRAVQAIIAPSAALKPGAAHGWRVDNGLKQGPLRDGCMIVVFSPLPDAVAWLGGISYPPSEIADIYIPLK